MSSAGIELPKQIERVSGLRERYRMLAHEPLMAGQNFAPAIAMMTAALDRAQAALAANDPIACCRAYDDLKGFSE